MSDRQLSVLAQVNLKTIRALTTERETGGTAPTALLTREAADRLLAVSAPQEPWTTMPADRPVTGVGTRRRVRALLADGHATAELTAAIDAPVNMEDLLHGTGQVSAATARAVAAVFTELQMTPGADDAARRRGRREGWPLPLEWDEDLIDDPAYLPERTRRPRRTSDPAERRAEVEQWMAAYRDGRATETTAQLAHRLNTTARTIERDKARIRESRSTRAKAS